MRSDRVNLLTIIFAAFLLTGILSVSRVEARLYKLKTPHYRVLTDVGPDFARLLAQRMEAIYAEYGRRFRGFDLEAEGRFQVNVYKSRRDYEGRMPVIEGSCGAFIPSMQLLVAYKEQFSEERVLRTLYHEGFHQFMYSCITRDAPIWINEGFAEYFAEAEWTGRGFDVGRVPGYRLRIIQPAVEKKSHIPLLELIQLDALSWGKAIEDSPQRARLQYNEAWSVVHFLIHARGGRYQPRVWKYLRELGRGEKPREAFQEAFGTNIRGFERAWAKYISELETDESECRNKIERILALGLMAYGDPRRFDSLEKLKTDLQKLERDTVTLQSSRGPVQVLVDDKSLDELFRCENDGAFDGCSFILLRNSRTSFPSVFCNHHKNWIYRGYYVKRKEGCGIIAEKTPRSTVTRSLRRALKSKARSENYSSKENEVAK
ncbi:MAG: DUF1570 domain-containing protein [Planctomycetes bacterium]|nr:DUF1570 domain-containing protein [Planctomycetota bacterium]